MWHRANTVRNSVTGPSPSPTSACRKRFHDRTSKLSIFYTRGREQHGVRYGAIKRRNSLLWGGQKTRGSTWVENQRAGGREDSMLSNSFRTAKGSAITELTSTTRWRSVKLQASPTRKMHFLLLVHGRSIEGGSLVSDTCSSLARAITPKSTGLLSIFLQNQSRTSACRSSNMTGS